METGIKSTRKDVPTARISRPALLAPGNHNSATWRNLCCGIGTKVIAGGDTELVSKRAAIRVERTAQYVRRISSRRIGDDNESGLVYRRRGHPCADPSHREASVGQGRHRSRSLTKRRGLTHLKFRPDFVACGRKDLRIDPIYAAVL